MAKSHLFFVWTLIVALGGFAAGRWANDQPAADVADDSVAGITGNPDIAPSQGLQRAKVAPVSSMQSKAVLNSQGKPSYVTDLQRTKQLIELAASNPQLAMEQTQQLKGALRAKAQAAILEVWGGFDPHAAWTWVQSIQPDNRSQFIHLLEVIGRSEPRSAISLAEKFAAEHRELRKDIYLATVAGLTQAGAYSQAQNLVEGLEIEPETKAELMNLVVSAWSAYEPQAALRWVLAQPEEFKTTAIAAIKESWADADPQTAVNFAASLSSGSERDALLQPAFKTWLATDSAAAANWLASLPANKDFDPLISELAIQPSANNGQVKAALMWAGKVHDPELRLNTVTSILSEFKQRDPDAAAAYLHELAFLTDAERLRLMEDLAFIK